MPETRAHIVYSTTGSQEDAARIARIIVEERLAACANIVPSVRSVYRWQGKIEDDSKALMVCKTASDRVDALISRIKELHDYDVPDIVAYPIDKGHPPYLDWIDENTREV